MWIAWAPKKRSERSRSRWRTGSGLLTSFPSTSIQESPRPGNSAATWGATQPCSGAGPQPRLGAASSVPAISALLRRARGAQQVLDPGIELGGGQVPDAGALQGPAGIGVGEGGTAADPVEARHRPVVVVADRHPPATLPDQ